VIVRERCPKRSPDESVTQGQCVSQAPPGSAVTRSDSLHSITAAASTVMCTSEPSNGS
jgi:hypothetical protein